MREFETGATRDDNDTKLNFCGALSPIALCRYVEYIGENRHQADGNVRDWDNWKKGIPEKAYIEGNARHFVDTWLQFEGYAPLDPKHDIEESLCGIIFNAFGHLHEILKAKLEEPK